MRGTETRSVANLSLDKKFFAPLAGFFGLHNPACRAATPAPALAGLWIAVHRFSLTPRSELSPRLAPRAEPNPRKSAIAMSCIRIRRVIRFKVGFLSRRLSFL